MYLPLLHVDGACNVTPMVLQISLAKFLKHAAVAGPRTFRKPPSLQRARAILTLYSDYIDIANKQLMGFIKPMPSDPTELAQFSGIAARGLADIACKQISSATICLNYEYAAGMARKNIQGKRPDFYCRGPTGQPFAVEAKGRQYIASTKIDAFITNAKVQSISGPLPITHGYAAVFLDLYGQPEAFYVDPVQEHVESDPGFHANLVRGWHAALTEEIKEMRLQKFRHAGKRYYYVPLDFKVDMGLWLLIDERIVQYSKRSDDELVKGSPLVEGDTVYVDRDGLGIRVLTQ